MATLILTTNQRHYIPVSSISHFTFITEVQEALTDPPIRCSIDAIAFTGKRLPIFHHYYRRSLGSGAIPHGSGLPREN